MTVRWNNKESRVGQIGGGDYAEVLQTIDKLRFDSAELTAAGITLRRGGEISLTEFGGYTMILDVQEPLDGPVKITWTVSHPRP